MFVGTGQSACLSTQEVLKFLVQDCKAFDVLQAKYLRVLHGGAHVVTKLTDSEGNETIVHKALTNIVFFNMLEDC